MNYVLAEANIGLMKAPLTDPSMAQLAARLDDLHGLAERSPGFVWRRRGETIAPAELRVFGDVFEPFDPARLFFTMSVWRDVDALRDFVYATVHVEVLRQKRAWMDEIGRPGVALWWIADAHRPTVAEAAVRLRALRDHGPSARAFNFGNRFPSPVVTIAREAVTSVDAQALIAELDAEIQRRYPGAPVHGLGPADLSDPEFSFYVARVDGTPAACGALRRREPGVVEVKRMYVRPVHRGLGLARAILGALEGRARALRVGRVLLETGEAQPEAIALYRSAGYTDIPRFGEYVPIAVSLCFEKRLHVG